MQDEWRPEAKSVIDFFRRKKIKTILLTGDSAAKAAIAVEQLGIDVYHAECSPEDKYKKIEALTLIAPTIMIGDGINDAPALAKATIGVSLSDASQLAIQQSSVVLMKQGLSRLPEAFGLGRHIHLTIQRNLFWAFAYNIIAMPVAALGLLNPTFSAMAMGFSDVMLALISLHLYIKKVN
jgi:Cu+-exporting ATPase